MDGVVLTLLEHVSLQRSVQEEDNSSNDQSNKANLTSWEVKMCNILVICLNHRNFGGGILHWKNYYNLPCRISYVKYSW